MIFDRIAKIPPSAWGMLGIALVAGAMFLVLLPIGALQTYCERGQLNTEKILQVNAGKQQPGDAHIQKNDTQKGKPSNAGSSPQPHFGKPEQSPAGQEAKPTDKKVESLNWTRTFWCDSKFSDFAVVYLTYCLAVIGVFQAYWLARTIDAAEDSNERQIRAYVHIQSICRQNSRDDPNIYEMIVTYRNYGQTPAYDVRAWMGVDVKGVPADSEFIRPSGTMPLGTEILPPGRHSEFLLPLGGELKPCAAALMSVGKAAIYTWGEIKYRDAFGRNRTTKFRYRTIEPLGHPNDHKAGPCETGNEAD